MTDNTPETQWKFQQAFGDSKTHFDQIQEADIISFVEFDETGNLLAVGDKGGRIVILQKWDSKKKVEYKVLTEFQSHESEFDYLKSLEIEEKINQIRWLKNSPKAHHLLSTNDKTIKLWKVHQKQILNFKSLNEKEKNTNKLPEVIKGEKSCVHQVKQVYSNGHAYHINSISTNSDGETFLSSDDLRINLWHLNHSSQSLTILDMKPGNMEDLTEVITSSSFHPKECFTFLYSSSKGALKIGDLRSSTMVSSFEKSFEFEEEQSSKTFFSEIISSISDAKFSKDGLSIIARDYMSIKIWDIRMEKKPFHVFYVHENLRPKLCDLYENDCIFDKFETNFSKTSKYIFSGSYKNNLIVFDVTSKSQEAIEISKSTNKKQSIINTTSNSANTSTKSLTSGNNTNKKSSSSQNIKKDFDNSDFQKKILHLSAHPDEDIIALSAVNNLYIYAKQPSTTNMESTTTTTTTTDININIQKE